MTVTYGVSQKSISLSITVRSTDDLNLVPNHSMASQPESPCFIVAIFQLVFNSNNVIVIKI